MDQQSAADAYALQDAFRRMSESCFRKCVRRYDEGGVSVGEGACLERCVHKWLDSYKEVGLHMQRQNQAMEQQQREMQ